MAKNNTTGKNKDRNYQPMKPDPTSDPDNNVVANRKISDPPSSRSTANPEIGSTLVRRNEADDED